MKEEKRGFKHHWKKVVRKKGFFPTIYLVVAALLLTGVLWYQNINRISEPDFDYNYQDDLWGENSFDQDEPSEPVATPVESLSLPVMSESNAQIVTKFYNYESDQEEQEQALVFYDNNFYQSQGVDLAATNDDPLPVVAALSGEVVEVKTDPLLGHVVQIEHDQDIITYYSSLTDVEVEPGQTLAKGDVLAHAGTNVFNQDKGTHVHFEIRKAGQPVNPETFLDRPVTDIIIEPTIDVSDDLAESDVEELAPELESGTTTTPS